VYFYGVDGQQLGAYAGGSCALESAVYFGSKRVVYGGGNSCGPEYTDPVPAGTAWEADRLGSYGTYYPWGETKGSTNPADIWSFATYWRDSFTGLDYANLIGRFITPDPSRPNNAKTIPQNRNRYAYVGGDPTNYNDPRGLTSCDVNGDNCYDSMTVNGDTWEVSWSGFPLQFSAQMAQLQYSQLSPSLPCPFGETLMANGTCDIAIRRDQSNGTADL